MSIDSHRIWEKEQGTKHLTQFTLEAIRVVEAQHNSSTRKLVNSLEEHDILEQMIEETKPPLDFSHEFQGLHYLLFTPFRYPPLRHGSRFGRTFERALWYGSLDIETALTEVAFYRFYFLLGTTVQLGMLQAWLTAFVALIDTPRGVDLTQPPFFKYQKTLASPSHYAAAQILGTQMREAGVEAFLYYSARKAQGINVALFTPQAFQEAQPKPRSFRTWHCITTSNTVECVCLSDPVSQKLIFSLEDFS